MPTWSIERLFTPRKNHATFFKSRRPSLLPLIHPSFLRWSESFIITPLVVMWRSTLLLIDIVILLIFGNFVQSEWLHCRISTPRGLHDVVGSFAQTPMWITFINLPYAHYIHFIYMLIVPVCDSHNESCPYLHHVLMTKSSDPCSSSIKKKWMLFSLSDFYISLQNLLSFACR